MLLLAPDDWTDTWLSRALLRDELERCWGRGHGRLEEAGLRRAPAFRTLLNALTRSNAARPPVVVLGRYSQESLSLARGFRSVGSSIVWLDAPSLSHTREREARVFRTLTDRLILSDASAIDQWRAQGVDARAVGCPLSADLTPRELARESLDLTPRARSIGIVLSDRGVAKALAPALDAFATLVAQFASIDARIIAPPTHAVTIRRTLESRPFGVRPRMIHLDVIGKHRNQLSAFDIIWSDDRLACLVAAACGVPSVYVAGRDSLLERADARWWWQALSASIMHAESWQTSALVEQSELLIESAPSRKWQSIQSSRRASDGAKELAVILAPWLATGPVNAVPQAQ